MSEKHKQIDKELETYLWIDGIKIVIKNKCPNYTLVSKEDLKKHFKLVDYWISFLSIDKKDIKKYEEFKKESGIYE